MSARQNRERPWTTAQVRRIAALVIGAVIATFSLPAPSLAADTALRLPDLSAYDCGSTAATSSRAITVNHLGQFIKSHYVEWNEYYATSPDLAVKPQLICISQLVPQATQLSAADAKAFLTDSLAIGVPTGTATERAQDAADGVAPDGIQPEPLKRVSPSSTNGERAQSTEVDVPPVPATKSADPNAATNTAPASFTIPQNTTAQSTTSSTSPSTIERAQTIGVDDRIQVTNTTTYPWTVIGYLLVTYSNGASYRCSGTLVSPYVVMTAGHCIHNNNRGGYVTRATFYPGQSQATPSAAISRPYGSHSDWAFLKATQNWTQISGNDSYVVTDYKYDFAAIQFATPFTHTTTFMPVLYSSTTSPVTNGGYPGTVKNNDVYAPFTMSGAEQSTYLRSSHVREFSIDATGGDSGGAFWATDSATGRPALVGSLSYGDDLDNAAGGPWYDSWNQALISDWMSWTPTGATVTATNGVTGLRVASIFSSAQTNSQSYIRLYNPGGSAGTVDLTLADYATGTALATWTSPSIPGGASIQYPIKTIESGASTPITSPPSYYSLSVRPTFDGYFQHALCCGLDGTITDVSTCDSKTTTDQKVLINVHSSLLQNSYPSTVVVQNTGTTSTTVAVVIYDANSGARLGAYYTPLLPPNGQDRRLVSDMEVSAGFRPTAAMYHYVIRAESTFTGYIQHLVRNASGTYTDMSAVCSMAKQ